MNPSHSRSQSYQGQTARMLGCIFVFLLVCEVCLTEGCISVGKAFKTLCHSAAAKLPIGLHPIVTIISVSSTHIIQSPASIIQFPHFYWSILLKYDSERGVSVYRVNQRCVFVCYHAQSFWMTSCFFFFKYTVHSGLHAALLLVDVFPSFDRFLSFVPLFPPVSWCSSITLCLIFKQGSRAFRISSNTSFDSFYSLELVIVCVFVGSSDSVFAGY